ncbi:hypothetical protein M9458_034459, partial [Cirrhinus mrigala]
MGKPLSRPGCLRQSPCCSKKGDEREGYNEDGYIPQRSIYDTMCINEQIDHSSAHSTLGSRRVMVPWEQSSVLGSSGRKLDERFIFDSLKLANDELSKSASAPSGSMNKRHHHQDSGKKDNLCRHSWKVLSPPKFPETFELSPGEKTYLNPGVAFFPNSFTSPQISPFSGSPFSTGTHTPSVFFSPSPLPYHQQFNRQSLPTHPSSARPPLSELSVSALMCGQEDQDKLEIGQGMRESGGMPKDNLFLTFKPQNIEPEKEPPPTTPEPETDTTPLLRSQTSKRPAISPTPMESTWPRRLIGRRRTVRQGGAEHNLPILPPLPSLLIRSVSDKKTIPRLSPFPEHQGNVDGQLGKSTLTRDLKECSLQEWKLLREQEERKAEASKIESVIEEDFEEESKMILIQESVEPGIENTTLECEEENWEAVLEMVNSLWDESWNEDLQSVGSLRRWPLLHPPSGFGGSQAPSGTSSELGAEDMLEIERMNREVVESLDDDEPQFQYNLQTCEGQRSVIVTQPGSLKLAREKVPTSLDLATIDAQMGNKYGHSESPDSNLTLDSDSSGVYMSNPSQTSREDITSDNDRAMSDLGSITSLSQGEEGKVNVRKTGAYSSIPKANTLATVNKKDPSGMRAHSVELGRQAFCKEITTKATEMQARLKPVDTGSPSQEIHNTVNTSKTDVPLPLSPSKHEAKETLLVKSDADPFVATDSFVYLAVSVLPPTTQESVKTKPAPEEPPPPTSFAKPCPYPDECDFLSTDSFVYLAAPDCHLLVTEGHSVYDSESEDSGSKADFVLASAVGGDSDWDSDLTDSEHEPNSSKPAWDYWEELEQGVLQELFGEDQSDADKLLHGNQAQQISCQPGELAAIVVQERAELEEVSSQYTQGAETHTE